MLPAMDIVPESKRVLLLAAGEASCCLRLARRVVACGWRGELLLAAGQPLCCLEPVSNYVACDGYCSRE